MYYFSFSNFLISPLKSNSNVVSVELTILIVVIVSSVSSKQADVVVKAAQKEVENYGIVEINNNSAKSKVKNVNV